MKKVLLYALSASLLTTSCYTSKIASSKSNSFNQKIEKVFISFNESPENDLFYGGMALAFKDAFTKRGINYYIYFPETFRQNTRDSTLKSLEDYQPQFWLRIEQTDEENHEGLYMPYFFGQFDIQLLDGREVNTIWSAQFEMANPRFTSTRGYSMAKKIIKKMVKDGLLDPL
jgi:hypothetical protein